MATTTNLVLTQPVIGASSNSWGNLLNDDLDLIDGVFDADGDGTSVGLHVGTGKVLKVEGTINLPAGALPGAGIADNSIVPAKIAMPATDLLVGRSTAGAGAGETVPCTAQGRSLLAAADPAAALDVLDAAGTGTANTFTETQIFQESDDTASVGPHLVLNRISLTPSPADALGRIAIAGRDTDTNTLDYAAIVGVIKSPTPIGDPIPLAGELAIETTVAGILAKRFRFGHGLFAEGVTGGDKGDGSINAKKVYVNGTDIAETHPLGSVVAVAFEMFSATDTTSSEIPADTTVPQTGEGKVFMTLAHTPKRTANQLRIDVVLQGGSDTDNRSCTAALFRDDATNSLAASGQVVANSGAPFTIAFTYWMDGGLGTDEIIFKVRGGLDGAGTLTFNRYYGSRASSSITITEHQGP